MCSSYVNVPVHSINQKTNDKLLTNTSDNNYNSVYA